MLKKKVLITGGSGMLAYDFFRTQKGKYDIILTDREECDITSFESVMQHIAMHEPDVVLNCAAYTAVDDAEDIGMQMNYEVNTLGVYNLAKATAVFGVLFITISTDYVFDGTKREGYLPSDECHPINAYGMAKYLGEKLARDANPQTIIIRTSWLYGGELGSMSSGDTGVGINEQRKQGKFKNFVNTMLTIAETRDEVKVVDDQHGIPTNCVDLSEGIARLIEGFDSEEGQVGGIVHITGSSDFPSIIPKLKMKNSITWADFAEEIFAKYRKTTKVVRVPSSLYPTKAKRPEWSILL